MFPKTWKRPLIVFNLLRTYLNGVALLLHGITRHQARSQKYETDRYKHLQQERKALINDSIENEINLSNGPQFFFKIAIESLESTETY